MAIANRVSSTLTLAGNPATGSTGALTGTAAGDLITLVFRERDGGVPSSISDTVNGSWDLTNNLAVRRGNGVGDHTAIYYFWNSGAGNPVVTVSFGGAAIGSAYVDVWSGAQTTSAVLDQVNSIANPSGMSHSHGSITTTTNGLILTSLACGADPSGWTPDTGFTARQTLDKNISDFKITTSTETTTATGTSGASITSNGAIASFKEASGGGTAVPVFVNNLRVQGIL